MSPNSKITQELYERIEAYLFHTLSKEEHLSFEELLKNDLNLQKQVAEYKLIFNAIEKESLKEQLNEFHQEISKNKITNTSKIRYLSFRKIAVAAVILILGGSFWFFSRSSNEKLYAKYFSPDPGLTTTMSSTRNFNFYDAMVNYKHGDYEIAIVKWTSLQQIKPTNDTLNYFLGVAHLANKNEKKAIDFLNLVTKTSNSSFKNDAYYYLGLAYLKADNIPLAKKNTKVSTLDKSKELLLELNE